jgi:hypothetical protein
MVRRTINFTRKWGSVARFGWLRGKWTLQHPNNVVLAKAGTHTEIALSMDPRIREDDGGIAYFFDGEAAAAAPPGLLKYLKKSELESSTMTSPWFLKVVR